MFAKFFENEMDCKRQLRKTGREIDRTNKELLGAITNFVVSLGILVLYCVLIAKNL